MKLYNCFQRLNSTPGDYKCDTGVKFVGVPVMFYQKFYDLYRCQPCWQMATIVVEEFGVALKVDLLNTCGLFERVKHYNQVGGDAVSSHYSLFSKNGEFCQLCSLHYSVI